MIRFFQWLFNLFFPSETIDEWEPDEEQIGLFEDLDFGDIVYAKMPLTASELEQVPEGHQARPYFVVGKRGRYVLAVPGTSKEKFGRDVYVRKAYLYPTLYRYGQEYDNYKNTYFVMSNVVRLPQCYLEYYWGTTNKKECEALAFYER